MTTTKRLKTYETTVVDAFEDAASEVENLAEEMRSIVPNDARSRRLAKPKAAS